MASKTSRHRIEIDGIVYRVQVVRKVFEPPDAPRLVMAAYHPNELTARITQVAARSIHRYAGRPYELWIVDNASPRRHSRWLIDEPGVNVVFNPISPLRPLQSSPLRRAASRFFKRRSQLTNISYANGIGFELGAQLVDLETQVLCALHSDVLACKSGWLDFLISKLDEEVRGAAVATHTSGLVAMSASCFLVDFSLYRPLRMHFLPNMPHWDAGELVTVRLNEAGYRWFVAENTFDSPELIGRIPQNDPLHHLHADRSFDDEGNVFFMHLGRGATKATGRYHKPGKTTADEWIAYAQEVVLA